MKARTVILAAIFGSIVITVCGFLIAECARAQTPAPHPDIILAREGSTYTFRCQPVEPIDKLALICAVRSDLAEPEELGCVDHTIIDAVSMTVTVQRTPHVDGKIRCYAADSEGNVSDYSDNAGLVDFTPPGKPNVK
jgi:hypothetical protein